MLAADMIFFAALAFVVVCNVYFAPRLPDRVAMQWGSDEMPTWHASKPTALWGMIAFMIAGRLFIWIAMAYIPEKVHGAEIGVLLFSIIAAASHVFTLKKAVKTI